MTWFRVDDKFAFHRKAVQAGNTAIGVWVRLGAWSSDQMTDGWLPSEVAIVIEGPDAGALDRLCDVGLLERDGKNYKLHDFLDWNPSAKLVKRHRKELSAKRSKAGGKGAEARWQKHGPDPDPDPDPDPSKKKDPPVSPPPGEAPKGAGFKLEPSEPGGAKKDRKKPERPLPDDWQPNAAHFKTGRECGLDDNRVRFEAERFRDHARANDRRQVDWQAAFANWIRGAKPGPAPVTFRPVEPKPRQGPPQPPRFGADLEEGREERRRLRREQWEKPPRVPEPPPTEEELEEVRQAEARRLERLAEYRRTHPEEARADA